MQKTQYDIFISYRRNGGFATALLIQKKLIEKGFRVFMDVEALKSGKFNEQLYNVIDMCRNVIFICSPGCMDRFSDPDDWVRKELSYAIKQKKIVIPVMLKDFEFPKPETLPAELSELVYYNALKAEMELFDESIEKLCKNFLTVRPGLRKRTLFSAGTAILILLAAVILSFALSGRSKTEPQYPTDVKKSIDAVCVNSIGLVENNGSDVLTALKYCDNYLNGDVDEKTMSVYCDVVKRNIDSAVETLQTSEAVREKTEGVLFCTEIIQTSEKSKEYKKYIEFALAVATAKNISVTAKKSVLDHLRQIIVCDYLITLNQAYGAIQPIITDGTDTYESETDKYVFQPNTATELSVYINDSLFGTGGDDISEEKINSIIDAEKKAITQHTNEICAVAGSLWKEYQQKGE